MTLDRWIRDSDTGRIVVFQVPNPALWVFFSTYVLRWFTHGSLDHRLAYVGTGALIVWAADELVRGDAPIRRVFGIVVLGWELWHLFSG